MRSVGRAKFREDVFDVALDCVLGNRELISNQFICIPASKQAQDIDFSQGQRVIDRMFGELRSDLRRDALFSRMETRRGENSRLAIASGHFNFLYPWSESLSSRSVATSQQQAGGRSHRNMTGIQCQGLPARTNVGASTISKSIIA